MAPKKTMSPTSTPSAEERERHAMDLGARAALAGGLAPDVEQQRAEDHRHQPEEDHARVGRRPRRTPIATQIQRLPGRRSAITVAARQAETASGSARFSEISSDE